MNTPVYHRDLVLIGGGHAHVQVVKRFGMAGGLPGVRVTLVSDSAVAWYSGMLPGCLAGLYTPEDIRMELRPLTRWAGVRFIQARVAGIDPDRRQILFDDRPALGYDALSVNIGSTSPGLDIPGVQAYATPTRPLGRLIEQIDAFEASYTPDRETPAVVVVGAGAAGVELAFAMHARWLRRYGRVRVTVVDVRPDVLQDHHARVRRVAHRYFRDQGIEYIGQARAERAEPGLLLLSDGTARPFHLLLWATGGAPPALLARSNLETDETGFITVLPTLQTTRYATIFAAGDCIHFTHRPLPKAGVYAVREGPYLVENLKAFLQDKPLKPYKPQTVMLSLLMTGNAEAIASWRFLAPHGRWVWRLKDWIDRRWMRAFDPRYLPAMKPSMPDTSPQSPASQETMRCAGCGAKVGSTILTGVLDSLDIPANPRVRLGLAEADDAAALQIPPDRLLLQTVDGFRAFIDDLYLFGRIAMVHAASDVYAMGGHPDTALILVTLPYAAKHLTADDLKQLMAGAADEARRMGVTIIGGHTGEGAEPAIGVVMNGLGDPARLFTKGGLKAGDDLILTKPLGTGVLLAADMRRASRGLWMDAAIEQMLRSNGPAADTLREAGVHAVTDVTGFGLAGHLAEMLEASQAGAELFLPSIPALPGASACLAQGIQSTLAPSNREHLEKRWRIDRPAGVNDDILYDPQTSGGLLAGVTPKHTEAVLGALRAAGYPASVVGRVTGRPRTLALRAT